MREKYVKLIIMLQERKGFVKGGELAQKLCVSDRTIRNYIKDLNENYLVDACIKNNKSKGYILTGDINEIKRTQQVEFEERAFFIIKYLLEKESWVTYEEIAEALLFSSQTIRNDVLKIQQLMDDQLRHIKVESIIFQGIRLRGSEIDKRLFLDSLSNPPSLTNLNFQKTLAYYFKHWTTTDELTQLINYFQTVVNHLRIPSNKENLLPIISYLVICLKRMGDAHLIEDASDLLDKYDITETKEYMIAQQLLTDMGSQKGLHVPDAEIVYFSFYLMSQRLLFEAKEDNEPDIPEAVRKHVLAAMTQLEQEYNMDFSADSQLSSGLILHLARDIYPLLFNFYIENAFITTIKQEYIQAYHIAVSFTHLISKQLHLKIPENEIGYLALHFASFIERKRRESVEAVIVSGRNKPASLLLKKELERKIAHLAIEKVIAFEEISELDNRIQLLISPLNVQEMTELPVVQVNELATSEDISRLRIIVNKLLSNKLLKIDSFSRLSLKEKPAILKHLLQEVQLDCLYESVMERERLSTTEVGNGVAIPHPLSPSNHSRMKIAVAALAKPVAWGSEEVSLVFLLIPGKDKQAEMSMLMDELHRIISNTTLTQQVTQAASTEEVQAILDV